MKTFWIRWLALYEAEFDMDRCWCTGYGDDCAVYCAVVDAENEAAAKAAVSRRCKVVEFSFCDEKAPGYLPGGGRFPVSGERGATCPTK